MGKRVRVESSKEEGGDDEGRVERERERERVRERERERERDSFKMSHVVFVQIYTAQIAPGRCR